MNKRQTRAIKISFPFGLYFEQLFSHDTYVKFINPFNFWRKYRIEHLESCRELNTVRYLENCHQLEWQPLKLPNSSIGNSSQKLTDTSNAIFVFEPGIELKYRGVTYRTQKIVSVNVNINSLKIDSEAIKINNHKQSVNYKQTNISEIFGSNS